MNLETELSQVAEKIKMVEKTHSTLTYKQEQLTKQIKEDLEKLKAKGHDVTGVSELVSLRDSCNQSLTEVISIIKPKIEEVLGE